MKLSKREQRKIDTEQRIYDSAIKLFTEKGFEPTTLQEIAKEAKVSTGTLYKFFPSKNEIIDRFVQNKEFIADIKAFPADMDPKEAILLVIYQEITLIKDSENYYKLMLVESNKSGNLYRPEIRALQREPFLFFLKSGKASGRWKSDFDCTILADLIVILYFDTLNTYFFSGEKIDMMKYFSDRMELIFDKL